MNRYKLFATLAAGAIIIAGVVYLYAGALAVPYVLAVCALSIGAMGAAHLLEAKAKKDTSLTALIPSVCLFVLSLAVLFACVYSFIA